MLRISKRKSTHLQPSHGHFWGSPSDRQTSRGRQEWRDTRLHVRVGISRLFRHCDHQHYPPHDRHIHCRYQGTSMITSHQLKYPYWQWGVLIISVALIWGVTVMPIIIILAILTIIVIKIIIIITILLIMITPRKGQGCDTAHAHL